MWATRSVIHKSTGLPGRRAELSSHGKGLSLGPVSGNASRAVKDAQRAVEVLSHFDLGPDKMRSQRRGRDLQPAPTPQHGIVVAHLARLLDAQDLIDIEVADRDKGLAGLFRRHRKARVVGRHEYLTQIAVGGSGGGDPSDSELLGQPVLESSEGPLRAAPRLGRRRRNMFDAELRQGPADPRLRRGRPWVRTRGSGLSPALGVTK